MSVWTAYILILARRIARFSCRSSLLVSLLLAGLIGPLGHFAHADSSDNPANALTEAEQQWLAERHTVRTRVIDFPPYQITQPTLSGQSVDLLSSIAARYGFKVEYVGDTGDFLSAQQDVMGPRKRLDMLLTMNRTPEREQQFALTEDYLSMPWVIYTRNDSPFISNVAGLAGKVVSVEKGYVVQEKLKNDQPSIRFLVEPNPEEALRAVATGRADAYVGNLAVGTYLTRRFGLANLVVAAPTHYGEHKQAMAIRKDWEALRSIIDKGIVTMPVDERNRITKKWAQVETRAQIDYSLVWKVLIAASLLIAAFIYWNRRLANEVGRRKASEERYRLLAENSHDVIWTMDLATRRFTYISPSIQQLRGFTPEEVMAQPPGHGLTPDSQKAMRRSFQSTLNRIKAGERNNLSSVFEAEQPHRDGHIIATEIVMSWLFDEADQPKTLLGVSRDITERRKAQEVLVRIAQTDALTGLSNRRHFMQSAEQELARTARYGGPLSVMMVDIDFFKKVNDTHGHQTGDLVIQAMASVCRATLRECDIIGRLGGEEFAVVLPETDAPRALEAAERLRQAIARTSVPLKNGTLVRFTVSIGVVTMIDPQTDIDTLLGCADAALYEAKGSGRNLVRVGVIE